jgi:hypothetical protein
MDILAMISIQDAIMALHFLLAPVCLRSLKASGEVAAGG